MSSILYANRTSIKWLFKEYVNNYLYGCVYNLNNKENSPVKIGTRFEDNFTKGNINGQSACEKRLNIISHQVKTNQNHNEIPYTFTRTDLRKRLTIPTPATLLLGTCLTETKTCQPKACTWMFAAAFFVSCVHAI